MRQLMQNLEKKIREMNLHKNKRKNNNNRKRCPKYYFSNRKRTGIGTKRQNKTIRSKNTSSSTGTETNVTRHQNKTIRSKIESSSTGTENKCRNQTTPSKNTTNSSSTTQKAIAMNTAICNATTREVIGNGLMMGAESYIIAICIFTGKRDKQGDIKGKVSI